MSLKTSEQWKKHLDKYIVSNGDTLRVTAVHTRKSKYAIFCKEIPFCVFGVFLFFFLAPPLYMLPCSVDHSVTQFGKYTL